MKKQFGITLSMTEHTFEKQKITYTDEISGSCWLTILMKYRMWSQIKVILGRASKIPLESCPIQ